MKLWEKDIKDKLDFCLNNLQQEVNELDWKEKLSSKPEKLEQALSAFSNLPEGGYLIYGIDDEGAVVGFDKESCKKTIEYIGNLARNNIRPEIAIDHSVLEYKNNSILVFKISEASSKPVHLASGTLYDAYIRSAGQNRKLSQEEVHRMIATSSGVTFEKRFASKIVTEEEVINKLDVVAYCELSQIQIPKDLTNIVKLFESENFIQKEGTGYRINNLGAILFAKNITEFETLERRAVRVIQYEGNDRLNRLGEVDGKKGYAAGFKNLISHVLNIVPANEIIKDALRQDVKMYPEICLREIIANALIHQDFDIVGTSPTIEIFSDRIEIKNPGTPFVNTNRLLDLPPRSRNEKLASIMRRFRICEESGTGIDKVIFQTEVYQLPAPSFEVQNDHFIVTLFAHKPLSKMNTLEKVNACYWHACLKAVAGRESVTNETVRKRFNILDTNYPIATRIINETIKESLIKDKDPTNKSNKKQYVPFWFS